MVQAALPKGAKPIQSPAEVPHLEVGDHVYFKHLAGPMSGKVVAYGAHGCTLDVNGKHHKVTYDRLLGHKVRVTPTLQVVDDGDDGFIAADPAGRRRYFHDPLSPEGGAGAEEPMRKSLTIDMPTPRILLVTARSEDLLKAVANRPGLHLQPVTTRTGVQTQRWKRNQEPLPKTRPRGGGDVADRAAADHPEAGADAGFGTHNLETGDTVTFRLGALEGKGKIVGKPGKDGAYVEDSSGHPHAVKWSQITGHDRPASGPKSPGPDTSAKPEQESDGFSAADFAKQHDDAEVTPAKILAKFPPDTAHKIAAVQERLRSIEQTIDQHKKGDAYTAARAKLHREIIFTGREGHDPDDPTKRKHYPGLLSAEAVAGATPGPGEKPTFTMLGGRGGSGKSSFKGKVYHEDKAIVLDADVIKHMLPEYEGWNAHQVHEESSDILDEVLKICRDTQLNVVLDATMKTAGKAVGFATEFKSKGYRVEAHYMHLPRQVAAHRAVERFLGKTGRFVPPEAILANTGNEKAFDEVRKHADKWSFSDNNVARGQAPRLIAASKDPEAEKA